ncbi:MAG: hypothetical protein ACE5JR_02525 [Gemmatimonadota bacterium]
MSEEKPGDGYTLLRTFGALKAQLRELRRRWRTFGRDPGPRTLAALGRAAASVSARLAELERLLPERVGNRSEERVEGRGLRRTREAEPSGQKRPPSGRETVEASRRLDRLVWEAGGAWHSFRRGREVRDLFRVEERLTLALEEAETLAAAIASAAPPPSPTAEATPELGQVLEAMLWRIASTWQHLRRHPSHDRIAVLRDEIAEALRVARSLLAAPRSGNGTVISEPPSDVLVSHATYRDPATGMYDREGFDATAGAELKRCRRYGRPFGLLLLRLAPSGLEDLRRRLRVVNAELREYDILARHADRNVVVGLPESGSEQTRLVGRRIEAALRAVGRWGAEDRWAAACLPDDGSSLSALTWAASARLDEDA